MILGAFVLGLVIGLIIGVYVGKEVEL